MAAYIARWQRSAALVPFCVVERSIERCVVCSTRGGGWRHLPRCARRWLVWCTDLCHTAGETRAEARVLKLVRGIGDLWERGGALKQGQEE